jgi:hypothetical protein
MVVDNVYLITFKIKPLQAHARTHIHTCHCLKHRRKVLLLEPLELAITFDLMSSMDVKRVLLRPMGGIGNRQK